MTVTPVRERPAIGAAHHDAAVVTVGTFADGRPARLTVGTDGRSGGRAEHVTVYGDTQAGVTTLLRNILTFALDTGWKTVVVDPNADTITACSLTLCDEYETARQRARTPAEDRQMRLIVIDDLQTLVKHRRVVHNLTRLATVAGPAGTAVVAGTHDVSLSGFGGRYRDATLTRASLTQNLVTLRIGGKPLQRAALRALGVDMNRLGARLAVLPAGVGYLPRIATMPLQVAGGFR